MKNCYGEDKSSNIFDCSPHGTIALNAGTGKLQHKHVRLSVLSSAALFKTNKPSSSTLVYTSEKTNMRWLTETSRIYPRVYNCHSSLQVLETEAINFRHGIFIVIV
jgi:hypothetical protein